METQIGNHPFKQTIHYKNADSVNIPVGSPIVFLVDGVNDGFSAVLPSNATDAGAGAGYGLFAGISCNNPNTPPGEFGTALIWGFYNSAKFLSQTRAASTDSFASAAAIGLGGALFVQNDVNVLGAGQVAVELPIVARLAQNVDSQAAVVSNSSNSSLIRTLGLKVIVRGL